MSSFLPPKTPSAVSCDKRLIKSAVTEGARLSKAELPSALKIANVTPIFEKLEN